MVAPLVIPRGTGSPVNPIAVLCDGALLRVGLSHDLYSSAAQTSWGDIGLAGLDEAGVAWDFLPADDGTLSAAAVEGYDADAVRRPRVTARRPVRGPSTPQLFARFGVGLDAVDLVACSSVGAAVTITPDGAKRAVATAALTLILAVEHRLIDKHRLVEQGRWQDRQHLMGRGLDRKDRRHHRSGQCGPGTLRPARAVSAR